MFNWHDLGNNSAALASPLPGHPPIRTGRMASCAALSQEVSVQPGNPQPQLSDKALMGFVTAQEDWALQMLYDRYFRRAFALAYRMLGDTAAAEDCVQDVFLKIWQQPQLYSPERGAFSSWLLTVVHHRAANTLRARRQVAY